MSEENRQMVIGDWIVNFEYMNTISRVISPEMTEVWNTSKWITVKSLTEDTAKRMPDTDIHEIELCAQYLFDRELNRPLDIGPVLAEMKKRGME